ncbi:hypothetical protein [Methanogenium organophilum]|uniref:DUF4430 domain-containing protein n=1 Tax=Methanogenium organophilum TaxID=2199 RepID=A0A9X9S1Y3_METOG|nr:hypothetical protein [Methanogenium organophilum]WAI00349.1 hypothetical protein OU421_07870 [Methanogenium organophilum]
MVDLVNKKGLPFLFALLLVLVVCAVPVTAAASTEVTVQKIAADGTTVLDERTISATEMEATLPIMGDGTTHYYGHGPTFNPDNLWDEAEEINWEDKDSGAVRGTDIKDLCDLVGGANAGETIQIGEWMGTYMGYSKTFPYENVYSPDARQGQIVLTWETNGDSVNDGSYSDGMRTVFFADTSSNPQGKHVYGTWDMHETLSEEYWHFFSSDGVDYPATTGLYVKWVNMIRIYSDDPAPVNVYDGSVTLPDGTFSWTDSKGDSYDISCQTPLGALDAAAESGEFTYEGTWKTNINGAVLDNVLSNGDWYNYTETHGWNYQLNGEYINYWSATDGISAKALSDGDTLVFYYGPQDDTTTENATALITIDVNIGGAGPVQVYDGSVTLPDGTFSWTDSKGDSYDISCQTPLGALDAAAESGEFTYEGTWKTNINGAVLDNVLSNGDWYNYTETHGWNYQLNGEYINYWSSTDGISAKALSDGDTLVFYYGPQDDTTIVNATALITIDVNIGGVGPVQVYDGSVTLADGSFSWTDSNGDSYDITCQTPLGALDAAAESGEFTYEGTWKTNINGAVLDNVLSDSTWFNYSDDDVGWNYQLNGEYINYWSPTDGISAKALSDGDTLVFYYGPQDDTTTENATALITIDVSIPGNTPTGAVDVLYEGSVELSDGTFTWDGHDIAEMTPHGALEGASDIAGFEYVGFWSGDKNTAAVDNIGSGDTWYNYTEIDGVQYAWNYQINGVYQYYWSDTTGISNNVIEDGDYVEFYYGPKESETLEDAEAVIRIWVNPEEPIGPVDVIYEGSVQLGDGTFTWDGHDISEMTPHGALEAASDIAGFEYVGFWSGDKNTAAVDNIGSGDTWYNYTEIDGVQYAWNYQLNGVYQYYWSDTTGISNNVIENGDYVEFYYGPKSDETTDNATAVIRMRVSDGSGPTPGEDWEITVINGDCTFTVDKAYFESGVACGHVASYTDDDGTWAGMPLYFLVGLVDDDVEHGPGAFNRELAAAGYSVEVTASDGYSINFESTDIADNDNIFAANTLNGAELPATIGDNKTCWPLRMSGSEVVAGKLVGGIATIELIGVPEPSAGWELGVNGIISDKVTEAEFNDFCMHAVTWTDGNGDVWEGVPLWVIAAVSDNYESTTHWTFDDAAAAEGYTVRITAGDGFNKTFASADMARSDDYILASVCNDEPLSREGNPSPYPLRLVGPAVWNNDSGSFTGSAISNITTIDLVELIPPEPAEGSWNLLTKGIITSVITEEFFEQALVCHHTQTWMNEETGELWSGIPLWILAGWVDDRTPHGSDGFNDAVALAGYTVIVTAEDGYSKSLPSSLIARNNNLIVANTLNGSPLEDSFPLRLVGPDLPEASFGVGNIAKIELTDFCEPEGSIPLTIVKYADDGVTELANVTVTWDWMADNMPVYGDGVTEYKFEGLCFPPNDPWDMNETYPGGFKISEKIKGTSIRELCELAGGMDSGTEIKFVATDGWTSKLSYDVIYEPADCVGEPVLAWYSTDWGGPMPAYSDGFRIFFITDDAIFGQRDMYEGIPFQYWHYNSGLPSCAGLSAKLVTRIELTTYADPMWNLTALGAIPAELSKGFFEGAMGCTMSGNHKATYTDTSGNTWEGMPLWLICGYVDDDNPHVGKSYNETLAEEGYDIHIIAEDGFETVIDSRNTIKNNNYIIANTLNGQLMRPDDGNGWPLRLVGPNVTAHYDGVKGVRNIVKIILDLPYAPDMYSGTVTAEWGDIAAGAPVQAFIGSIAAGTGVMADTNVYATEGVPFAVTGTQYLVGEPITFIVDGVEALEHPTFMGAQTVALDLTFPIGSLPVGEEDCDGVPPCVEVVDENVTVDLTGGNVDVDGSNIAIFPAGNGWESMLIETSGVTENATAATGGVTGVVATGIPVSGIIPEVGNVTAGFMVNLTGMPGNNASITSMISKEPSSEMLSYFQIAASEEGVGITDVAYTLNIQKSGITNGGDITSAVIRMAVTPEWVNAHGGMNAIRIIRHGEEGLTEVLETVFAGYDVDGLMIFAADSPNGLSLFGMAAVATASYGDSDDSGWVPTTTPTPEITKPGTVPEYAIISSAVTFSTADGTKTFSIDRRVAEANDASVVIVGKDVQIRMPNGTLHIEATGISEDGNLISGDVTRVFYEANPVTATLNGIGGITGGITLDLLVVPTADDEMRIYLSGDVPASVKNGLKQAAISTGKIAGDVAFIMPLSFSTPIAGSATVTLTAPSLWVESSGGAGNVMVAGYRSDGTAVLLPTTGTSEGVFTAESPVLYDGYGLVAVSAAETEDVVTTPAPTATPDEATPTASGSIFTTLALICAVFGIAGYAAMKKR